VKKHIKIYLDYFGYAEDEFMPCEICGKRVSDVHHIECRGRGGSKEKDYIENLMGVCRVCHNEYGDKKQHLEMLQKIHLLFMKIHGRNNGINRDCVAVLEEKDNEGNGSEHSFGEQETTGRTGE